MKKINFEFIMKNPKTRAFVSKVSQSEIVRRLDPSQLDFSKKEVVAGFTAAYAVFVIVYLVFLIGPNFTAIFSKGKEIGNIKGEIAAIEDTMSKQGILEKRLTELKEKLVLYEQKLPRENDVPAILSELSEMAKESNIRILGITPEKSKQIIVQSPVSKKAKVNKTDDSSEALGADAKKAKALKKSQLKAEPAAKPYTEVPITITAKSGYHQLGAFINRVENGKRLMKVADVDITFDNMNKTEHNVELLVMTYVLKRE